MGVGAAYKLIAGRSFIFKMAALAAGWPTSWWWWWWGGGGGGLSAIYENYEILYSSKPVQSSGAPYARPSLLNFGALKSDERT